MSTRHERFADKSLNERHSKILKELMMRPENRYCADCRKKDPRWASWNLGLFMCIRCSGVHRSMGTHISKVKSADLDAWTPEQIQNMQRWGNAKANMYWEHSLPSGFEPQDSNIDHWIRSKYERKQFVKPGPMPQPEELGPANEPTQVPQSAAPTTATMKKATTATGNLVSTVSSAPAVPAARPPLPPPQAPTSASQDLFEAFQSAPTNTTSSGANSVKADILSLYSKPTASGVPAFNSSLVGGASNMPQGSEFFAQPSAPFANFAAFPNPTSPNNVLMPAMGSAVLPTTTNFQSSAVPTTSSSSSFASLNQYQTPLHLSGSNLTALSQPQLASSGGHGSVQTGLVGQSPHAGSFGSFGAFNSAPMVPQPLQQQQQKPASTHGSIGGIHDFSDFGSFVGGSGGLVNGNNNGGAGNNAAANTKAKQSNDDLWGDFQ